jgi:hypothetical protein
MPQGFSMASQPDNPHTGPQPHTGDTAFAIPVHFDADPPETFPPKRRSAWEWVVDYNPFYLLSAVSMLLGCLLLSNTTTWDPVPLSTLLPLLGTLQVYELACLGIGLLLYRKLGPRRDAVQLLGLVLLFAVDVSFLMSEIATESLAVGAAVAFVLFVLAALKAGAIISVLKLEIDHAYLLTGMAGLFVLYVSPPLLTAMDDGSGRVEVVHFYALWWLIGLSPLIFDAARRIGGSRSVEQRSPERRAPLNVPVVAWSESADAAPGTDAAPDTGGQAASGTTGEGGPATPFTPEPSRWLTLIAVLPWASLAVHAGVLHYVYDRPFMAPHAAPLLVGLALLIRPRFETFDFALLRTLLLAGAVAVSLPDPQRMAVTIPGLDATLGTALLGCAAAWLAFAYVNAPRLLPHFAVLGLGALLVTWFGPTWEQVTAAWRTTIDALRRMAEALVPKTQAAWGLLAVVLAFAFLGLGALVSFARRFQRS